MQNLASENLLYDAGSSTQVLMFGLLGLTLCLLGFLVAQSVKNLLVVQETQVRSLGWEDPLKKEIATHSSILAWEISWTEEPGYSPWDYKRVRHNLATKQQEQI